MSARSTLVKALVGTTLAFASVAAARGECVVRQSRGTPVACTADTLPGNAFECDGIAQPAAEQIIAAAEAAVYFPNSKRLRWFVTLPEGARAEVQDVPRRALSASTFGEFRASLDRDFPQYRWNASEPYILKAPSTVARPIPPSTAFPHPEAALFSDSFESGMGNWTLDDNTLGLYAWGPTSCIARTGSLSADAVRGGANSLGCSAAYAPNVLTTMTHRNCEGLQGASQAWVDFHAQIATESGADTLGVFYAGSDDYYHGYLFSGTWTAWFHIALNLKQWYAIGDVTALTCPRIHVEFESDATGQTGLGVRVDDLTVSTAAPSFLACSINASPISGAAPLTVNFAPVVSNATTASYLWSFGDAASTTATTPAASFTYTLPGDYVARLRLDDQGARAYANVTIHVTTGSSCSVTCSSLVAVVGTVGTALTFLANSTTTGCNASATYTWTFGDGQTSSLQVPSHAYSVPGTYTWRMTAAALGATCTKSGTITISAGASSARKRRAVVPPSSGDTQVGAATVGASGGTLSGGGLTLTIPSGAFTTSASLTLTKLGHPPADPAAVTDTWLVQGLPSSIARDLTLLIDLPAGAQLGSKEGYYVSCEAPAWIKSATPDGDPALAPFHAIATINGSKASVVLPTGWTSLQTIGGASASSIRADSYIPAGGQRIKVDRLTRYETDHFYAVVMPAASSTALAILNQLEGDFKRLTDLGFSFSCRVDPVTGFRRILVEPKALGTSDQSPLGYHVSRWSPCGNGWFFNDYLEMTTDYPLTTNRMKAATAHELFHLVQDMYSPGGPNANLWLKDASSTWLEMSVVPDCPDVAGAYGMFPFNGLFNSKSSAVPTSWTETTSDREKRHGYGASVALRYRTDQSTSAFISSLWASIKGGSSETAAFSTALGTPIPDFWKEFARDYFEGQVTKCGPGWASFAGEKITDVKSLAKAKKVSVYPLSAQSWPLDFTKFSAAGVTPAVIAATGLADNQSVFVYSVAGRKEVAELTKDSPRYSISDVRDLAENALVLVLVDTNVPTGNVNSTSSTNDVGLVLGQAISTYTTNMAETVTCGDLTSDWGTWGFFIARWTTANAFEYTEDSSDTDSDGTVSRHQATITGTLSADHRTLVSFSLDTHSKTSYTPNEGCQNCYTEVWKRATVTNVGPAADWSPSLFHFLAQGAAARPKITSWYHHVIYSGFKYADNYDCTYPIDESKPDQVKLEFVVN